MQVITSMIKNFGSDRGKPSRHHDIEWDKVDKCRDLLQHLAYEEFQSVELLPSEKRRLLKDHLFTFTVNACKESFSEFMIHLNPRGIACTL